MQQQQPAYQYEINLDEDDLTPVPPAGAPAPGSADAGDVEMAPAVKSAVLTRRGRGFSSAHSDILQGGHFDKTQGPSLHAFADYDPRTRAQRSMEGWTLLLTGLHEELGEEELRDWAGDWGRVKEARMALDHRTGYVKGYALVDFEAFRDAKRMVDDGAAGRLVLMGQPVRADWAFLAQ